MKNFRKAMFFAWPFLLISIEILTGCSSSRKHYYFFDQHTYALPVVDSSAVIPGNLVASSEAGSVITVDHKEEVEQSTVIKKIALSKRVERSDTIVDPDHQKKMKRKRIFAATGFSLSTLGTAAVFVSAYVVLIPGGIIFAMILAGVLISALGVRNDRKGLRRLARIGAWGPIILLGLFILISIIAWFVEIIAPVE